MATLGSRNRSLRRRPRRPRRPRRLRGPIAATVLTAALLLVGAAPSASAATPAPAGLKLLSSTTTSLKLGWSAVKGAPEYRVQYSTSEAMTNATYRRFRATSGELKGLKPGTRYFVKVRVITAAGGNLSSYSPASTVLTKPSGTGYAKPSGLKVTARSYDAVGLAWGSRGSGIRYRVQYATSASMAGAKYVRVTGASTAVQGLKASTAYWFTVRVISWAGDSLSPYSGAIKSSTTANTGSGKASNPLRVGSFNVKCFNCVGTQPNERTWWDRRADVVSTIKAQHLDVIGIQEASQAWLPPALGGKPQDLSQFEDLRNRLGSPWALTNANRNNCAKAKTPTSCVPKDQGASKGTKILYNRDTLDLWDNGSKLLPSLSADAERYMAWAVLRQKSTGKKFFFVDAHLDPNKDQPLHVREATALADEVAKQNTAKLPTIIVGDMNSHKNTQPSNGVYDVLVDGYHYVDPLGNRAGSTTSTPGATVEKRIDTWVNSYNNFDLAPSPDYFGRRPNGTYIDYIFTTKMRVPEWETVAKLDAYRHYVGQQPSDHNLIRATVLLP